MPPPPLPLRSQSQSTASTTTMTSSLNSNHSASDHSTSPPLTPQTPGSLIALSGGGLPSLNLNSFLFESGKEKDTSGGLLSLSSEMLPQLPPLSISPPARSERSPISPLHEVSVCGDFEALGKADMCTLLDY